MHIRKLIHLLLVIATAVGVEGCQYKSEETLFGGGPTCDTTQVTYNNTIVNIINTNNCLSCHGAVSPLAGFSLTTYSDVKTVADNGKLYGAVFHLPGFPPMPQGGAQLTTCELNKVKAWIDAGTPEN